MSNAIFNLLRRVTCSGRMVLVPPFDFGTNVLGGVAPGVAPTDAVNKAQLDGAVTAVLVTGEVVNETPNGILDTFTVDNVFSANSEQVFVNRLACTRGAQFDYVATGSIKTIVFNAGSIPAENDVVMVSYRRP